MSLGLRKEDDVFIVESPYVLSFLLHGSLERTLLIAAQ
jgi:hypothetical protein